MRKNYIILGLLIIIIVLSFLQLRGTEEWNAFVYPLGLTEVGNCSPDSETCRIVEKFESEEACVSWGRTTQQNMREALPEWTFECGLNCEFDFDFNGYVCEKTID